MYACDLRPQVLNVAADLPEGHGLGDAKAVETVLYWRAPMLVGVVPDSSELIAGLWQEAGLLGVVAHGALTPLGRALLRGAGDPEQDDDDPEQASDDATQDHGDLAQVAAQLLPAAARTAMFQADLTAVVPGLPAAELAGLLDATADRESRGGATTWRFSPTSVRHALDAGRDAGDLLAELRGFAAGGALAQPLEYLIGDVARRHGAVRVRSIGCVLHADDPALIAEIASVRALSVLRLSVLAPTVLASAKPADETLAALRAAGYAPTGESADGTVRVEKAPRHRAPTQRRRPPAYSSAGPRQPRAGSLLSDRRGLAAALLAAQARREAESQLVSDQLEFPLEPPDEEFGLEPPDEAFAAEPPDDEPPLTEVDGPAASIVRYAGHLTGTEQAHLLAAIEDGSPIEISYTNAQGSGSVRVVEPIDLEDRLLVAWCQLREEERAFALDRIDAVAPA
jgi:hypothetical protein